jgi:hypothetical protein
MTTELELWLKRATCQLSRDSAARVAREIREHYESAREAALKDGAAAYQAERLALAALGDAKETNRQYRKVLLTSSEARMLRQGEREARAVCSRGLVRSLFRALPAVALVAAVALILAGSSGAARTLMIGAVGMGLLLLMPSLPIYTPSRSRILRYVKWVVLAAMPVLAFGTDALKFSWLLIACLWPVAWVEWTRVSIRRKLPVAEWPRHLYL